MKEYKGIHKSWEKQGNKKFGDDYYTSEHAYVEGANDFRMRALEALEMFTALSVDEPIIYKDKIYVSQSDVIILIEGLYAETTKTKKK